MFIAKISIRRGVRRGISEHGDEFLLGAAHVAEGAGTGFESDDPALTEWYTAGAAQKADDGADKEP